MRWNHIIGGLIVFALGLFGIYLYGPLVVEVLKGFLQPLIIALGLLTLAAAFFGKKDLRKINAVVAAVLLILGAYGLYDEYYAVVDFFNGALPLVLLVAGIVAVISGVRSVH